MSCTNESVTVFNDRWMLTQQATAGSSLLGCDSGCTAGYLFIGSSSSLHADFSVLCPAYKLWNLVYVAYSSSYF